jgi:hypothetical protein
VYFGVASMRMQPTLSPESLWWNLIVVLLWCCVVFLCSRWLVFLLSCFIVVLFSCLYCVVLLSCCLVVLLSCCLVVLFVLLFSCSLVLLFSSCSSSSHGCASVACRGFYTTRCPTGAPSPTTQADVLYIASVLCLDAPMC